MRSADPAQVAALKASIAEVGLLCPITVCKSEVMFDGALRDGFRLVAGLHRLEAARALGWQEIPANIVDLDQQQQIIAECDENLCGAKLTKAERAMFTARRKEAYELLHPETVAGVAGANAKHNSAVAKLATASFADDQAAKTGDSTRTVRRDAERGARITPEAMKAIKGTRLDNGKFLDMLKSVGPEDQLRVVRNHQAKSSPAASSRKVVEIKDDHDAYEDWFQYVNAEVKFPRSAEVIFPTFGIW
jgi:ParB family chromosome partitioning protein